MKLKPGFILKKIEDTFIVVPINQNAVDINGLITLNESGAFLWDLLSENRTEDDLVAAMTNEYEIETDVAKADIAEFLNRLVAAGVLE